MKTRPELLLHLNIPKPLHGLSPRTVLGQAWWDMKRQEAYKRTNYHCAACGIHKSDAKHRKWLEAHENYKIDYDLGIMTLIEINALCHYCHSYIHDGLLSIRLAKKEISYELYCEILSHGNKILQDNNLERPEYPDHMADWSDWRLVIDGKHYEPLWKNFAEWKAHYKVNLD